MVFQCYALYPHMSVAENMGFALKMQKVGAGSIRDAGRPRRLAARDRRAAGPAAAGAVAAASASASRSAARSCARPQAFLMDEPLSNLDAKLRVEMRAYIARLHQELGTTTCTSRTTRSRR